jgi:N6-adenosine-specific RNA methylase IME4
MDLPAIKGLPVTDWAAPDCALFLWSINSMLPQALAVIEAWGFTYKTISFTWAKRTPRDSGWHFGLGYWTRQNTESHRLGWDSWGLESESGPSDRRWRSDAYPQVA